VRLKRLDRLRSSLYSRVRNVTGLRAGSSAIVFAPHQDDETLACGGTIILKGQVGSRVECVFMTDGSTSHSLFMCPEALRRQRQAEARAAAGTLGLPSQSLRFLDFPDGRLNEYEGTAVTEVVAILKSIRPDEVFVPHRADGTPDHEATWRIVTEATRRAQLSVHVFEYPVWFWNQWPWVSWNLACDREAFKAAAKVLKASLGLAAFRHFRTGFLVSEVLPRKRRALEQYVSQMTPLTPGVKWPTLSEVSSGEFLNCFFQEYEIFRHWRLGP
jgi:LmbE family N-acetylglucosaminyl deacetylase